MRDDRLERPQVSGDYRRRAAEQRRLFAERSGPPAERTRPDEEVAAGVQIPWLLVVLTFLVWVGTVGWVAEHGMLRAYSDALAHELTARRVLDAVEPSFARLGTVWLPLPPLLMLPIVIIDPIWQSGLTGALIGLPCLVMAVISLYVAGTTIGGKAAGWLAAGLFVLNPNVLYLFTTPMTEGPALAFTCLVGAGVTRALAGFQAGRSATAAVLVTALGSAGALLSRYDGWILAVMAGLAIVLGSRLRSSNGDGRSMAIVIMYALIPGYAVILWLIYNSATYGDPLAFLTGQYSSGGIVEDLARTGMIPTVGGKRIEDGAPLRAALTYSRAVLECFGIAATAIGVAGLIAAAVQLRRRWAAGAVLVLTAPFWFYILALTTSQSVIITRWELPHGLFNVRYGTTLAPFGALAAAALLAVAAPRWRSVAAWSLFVVALVGNLWLVVEPGGPVVYAEGLLNVRAAKARASEQAAAWLAAQPDDGYILMADFSQPLAKYMLTYGGRPVRTFISKSDFGLWDEALADPLRFRAGDPPVGIDLFVALAPTSSQRHLDPVAANVLRNEQVPGFREVFRNSEVVIFRRDIQ
ncbi:MAG: hypothetical protein U0556_11650 [Dehalococcoidia bacterium]